MWRADVPAGVCEQAPCTLAPRASEGADANTRHAGIAYTPYACTQAWAWADKIAPARSPKTARRSMQFHVHRGKSFAQPVGSRHEILRGATQRGTGSTLRAGTARRLAGRRRCCCSCTLSSSPRWWWVGVLAPCQCSGWTRMRCLRQTQKLRGLQPRRHGNTQAPARACVQTIALHNPVMIPYPLEQIAVGEAGR